jgi:O-antigen chain-terminating methyltransferase
LIDNASQDSQASSEVCVPGILDYDEPLNVPRVDHSLDELYWVFENQFRGPRELIKQRLQVYLPYIQKCGAGLEFSPVLDLGCGRGEWLELLQENDLVSQGVDINTVMIALCQRRRLPVLERDILSFLRNTPDVSFGAVTGFHIIEHMSFEDRLIFFRECLRILQPGGIGIFETPNPANLRVGANYFYFDPSHLRPLPSESTKFFVKASGWVEVEILNLNPSIEVPSLERQEDPLFRELRDLFWGPMDYAIVARKALI